MVNKIIQVKDSIPGVSCASGNVFKKILWIKLLNQLGTQQLVVVTYVRSFLVNKLKENPNQGYVFKTRGGTCRHSSFFSKISIGQKCQVQGDLQSALYFCLLSTATEIV